MKNKTGVLPTISYWFIMLRRKTSYLARKFKTMLQDEADKYRGNLGIFQAYYWADRVDKWLNKDILYSDLGELDEKGKITILNQLNGTGRLGGRKLDMLMQTFFKDNEKYPFHLGVIAIQIDIRSDHLYDQQCAYRCIRAMEPRTRLKCLRQLRHRDKKRLMFFAGKKSMIITTNMLNRTILTIDPFRTAY